MNLAEDFHAIVIKNAQTDLSRSLIIITLIAMIGHL